MAEEIKQTGGDAPAKKLVFSPVFLISLLLLAVAVVLGVSLTKEKAKAASLQDQLKAALSTSTKAEDSLGRLREEKEVLNQKLEEMQAKIKELSMQLTVEQFAPPAQEAVN